MYYGSKMKQGLFVHKYESAENRSNKHIWCYYEVGGCFIHTDKVNFHNSSGGNNFCKNILTTFLSFQNSKESIEPNKT